MYSSIQPVVVQREKWSVADLRRKPPVLPVKKGETRIRYVLIQA